MDPEESFYLVVFLFLVAAALFWLLTTLVRERRDSEGSVTPSWRQWWEEGDRDVSLPPVKLVGDFRREPIEWALGPVATFGDPDEADGVAELLSQLQSGDLPVEEEWFIDVAE
jgi:hypothetical protein